MFQFVHVNTFSRKGTEGRSTSFVFGEARRLPEHSQHVIEPRPPHVVFGVPVDEVEVEHDLLVTECRVTLANGKKRAIRRDQHTLLAAVASHPCTPDLYETDPAARRDYNRWEALTVEWFRSRYGDALRSVVRHSDEGHMHVHALVLPPDSEIRAKLLHPGHSAKAQAVAAARAAGLDGKASNAAGDTAYKNAMRQWQDSYWEAVGLPSGLSRLGPGRRRLTRDQWQAEQAANKAAAVVSARAERAGAVVDRARHLADQAKADAAAAAAAKAVAERERAEAVALKARTQQRAAAYIAKVKRQAAGLLADAERRSAGARGIGSWISTMLAAMRGQDPARIAAEAAAKARAEAETVAAARQAAVDKLRQLDQDEAAQARRAAEDARQKAMQEARARAAAEARANRLETRLHQLQPPSPNPMPAPAAGPSLKSGR